MLVTHEADTGYELTVHLLVDAVDGSPIAPYEINLKTSEKVHTTRDSPVADVQHKEQILPMMEASRCRGLPKKIVHVIDQEADSLVVLHIFSRRGAGSEGVPGEGEVVHALEAAPDGFLAGRVGTVVAVDVTAEAGDEA